MGVPDVIPDPYEEDYRGPAVLTVDGAVADVSVALSGHPEPIDGRYHWYGRITGSEAVSALRDGAGTRGAVTLAVPGGVPAAAKLGERDPWGNLRITGTGQPPYPL